MTVEAITAATMATGTSPTPQLQAGYGVSFTDMGRFDNAVYNLQTQLDVQPVAQPSAMWQVVGKPLDQLQLDTTGMVDHARILGEKGIHATPSELLMFTARCHQFTFHCQLLHTVANKSSEGLSQLFRQQS